MTTSAESIWMDHIVQLGCVVCHLQGHPDTPAEVHHLLDGGRRVDHLHTIPLCSPGHHRNGNRFKISRHPNKTNFEAAYGTEESLLEKTRELVAQRFGIKVVMHG